MTAHEQAIALARAKVAAAVARRDAIRAARGHAHTKSLADIDGYAIAVAVRQAEEGTLPDDDAVADQQRHEREQLAAMAAFRDDFLQTAATSRLAADSPAVSRVHAEPPNPYSAEALAKWRNG